jgi:hypothetical protein
MDTTEKLTTTIRLSQEARLLVEELARIFGISQNAVYEQSIRRWARQESVTISDEMMTNFRALVSLPASGEGGADTPMAYVAKGYLDAKDDVAFRTSAEAASCFGKFYRGLQRGSVRHPKEVGKIIWFPKLYPNGVWDNRLSADENTIWDKHVSPVEAGEHIDRALRQDVGDIRIVFGKVLNPRDGKPYRFIGEYEIDRQATNYQDGVVWRRISERVKTYPAE